MRNDLLLDLTFVVRKRVYVIFTAGNLTRNK